LAIGRVHSKDNQGSTGNGEIPTPLFTALYFVDLPFASRSSFFCQFDGPLKWQRLESSFKQLKSTGVEQPLLFPSFIKKHCHV